MLLTALHLAARRGEIFGITWSDVDFGRSQVRLWTNKREGGSREYDWLPMTSELHEAFFQWKQNRPVKDTIYVFVCLEKTPFCEQYYGKPFSVRQHFMEKICVKAGVKKFGFHGIRHLTASTLYWKGYSLGHIQAVLRHKNPNTTRQYLKRLGLEHVREALEEGLKRPATVIKFEKRNTGTN
jgi:integrase